MTEVQQYFTTEEAAVLLRYSPATLNQWRNEGRGPAYVKGSRIRYRRDDLEQWANASGPSRKLLEAAKECHQEQLGRVKRLRGRAGADQRLRRLANEPFCHDCMELGIGRIADELDHIIPLSQGGLDEDSNVRSLCKPCHAARTREQRANLQNRILFLGEAR